MQRKGVKLGTQEIKWPHSLSGLESSPLKREIRVQIPVGLPGYSVLLNPHQKGLSGPWVAREGRACGPSESFGP